MAGMKIVRCVGTVCVSKFVLTVFIYDVLTAFRFVVLTVFLFVVLTVFIYVVLTVFRFVVLTVFRFVVCSVCRLIGEEASKPKYLLVHVRIYQLALLWQAQG